MLSGWTLARRLRTAVALFAALLALALLSVGLVLRQADRALSDQTQRILPARVASSQLLTALVDQETGLRGYAITHDDAFLVPYRQGLTDEAEIRRRLGRFIDSRDAARLDLLTVDAAITAWRQEYAALRLLDVRQGSALTSIQFGKELFDRIRASNAALDAELVRETRTAQSKADRDRRVVLLALVVVVAFLSAALVAVQRALRRSVLAPLHALGGQVLLVSSGQHDLAIDPVGPPDVRTMAAGVESMRLELVGALADVESRERDLGRRAAELARSNADLEQFAYVASHDLQEPLRKVASFCQLLEQRYGGQLDERGEQYIAFAVDGAKRMQQLITDLLTFSRVGRTSAGFVPVDLASTVGEAWDGLRARVQATGAQMELDLDDCVVHGDASLLQVLLGNLLGNALKYSRSDEPPRVRVTGRTEGALVRVDVADNGIGIAPAYAEKVFVIFQRLHGRDEYEGTGIGLALCKKVVEFHGGTIGLGESPLGGACITFTLPREESRTHV